MTTDTAPKKGDLVVYTTANGVEYLAEVEGVDVDRSVILNVEWRIESGYVSEKAPVRLIRVPARMISDITAAGKPQRFDVMTLASMTALAPRVDVTRRGELKYNAPARSKLISDLEHARVEFIVDYVTTNDANWHEADDEAALVIECGEALAEFAVKANKLIGGTTVDHIKTIAGEHESYSLMTAAAMLHLKTLEK